MDEIFTDTSHAALNRISEEHFFDSLTCFSSLPDVDVQQGDDLISVASPGIPNFITNAVFRCRLSPDVADTAIEQTNAYFAGHGVTPYWRLCPNDLPADLEARLVKHGLSLKTKQIAMAVDLERLPHSVPAPDHFRIERISDADMLQALHPTIRRFAPGKTLGTLFVDLFTAYGFTDDSRWQHYVGLLDDHSVACASIFYATGVAGLYMVGTELQARHKGIGSAMTLHALLDARERSYRVGTLQSSEMGYNMYRRLGFETCFDIKYYAPATA